MKETKKGDSERGFEVGNRSETRWKDKTVGPSVSPKEARERERGGVLRGKEPRSSS